jgi:uncharacterized protein YeaO (DUF488 family)
MRRRASADHVPAEHWVQLALPLFEDEPPLPEPPPGPEPARPAPSLPYPAATMERLLDVPPLVKLTRAQIRRGQEGLDITVKSGLTWARAFAPTWEMVCGHKNHAALAAGEDLPYPRHAPISNEEYIRRYRQILDRAGDAWKELYRYAMQHDFQVTLLCYCRFAQFCHTHLLIEYALQRWPTRFQDARDDDERARLPACCSPDDGRALAGVRHGY